ncbi:hypothetical protein NQZ68_010545 [Dissostichus eleginoides]|nr:hypothetical protein NQZ68_010545 [Dissostichus eleginoides]
MQELLSRRIGVDWQVKSEVELTLLRASVPRLTVPSEKFMSSLEINEDDIISTVHRSDTQTHGASLCITDINTEEDMMTQDRRIKPLKSLSNESQL